MSEKHETTGDEVLQNLQRPASSTSEIITRINDALETLERMLLYPVTAFIKDNPNITPEERKVLLAEDPIIFFLNNFLVFIKNNANNISINKLIYIRVICFELFANFPSYQPFTEHITKLIQEKAKVIEQQIDKLTALECKTITIPIELEYLQLAINTASLDTEHIQKKLSELAKLQPKNFLQLFSHPKQNASAVGENQHTSTTDKKLGEPEKQWLEATAELKANSAMQGFCDSFLAQLIKIWNETAAARLKLYEPLINKENSLTALQLELHKAHVIYTTASSRKEYQQPQFRIILDPLAIWELLKKNSSFATPANRFYFGNSGNQVGHGVFIILQSDLKNFNPEILQQFQNDCANYLKTLQAKVTPIQTTILGKMLPNATITMENIDDLALSLSYGDAKLGNDLIRLAKAHGIEIIEYRNTNHMSFIVEDVEAFQPFYRALGAFMRSYNPEAQPPLLRPNIN